VAPHESGFKGKRSVLNLLTAAVALCIAGAVLILQQYFVLRDDLAGHLATLSQVIAENSTASLAFSDPRAGRETLRSLRALPNITAAALYNLDGRLFADYRRDGGAQGSDAVPDTLAEAILPLQGQTAVSRSVALDGRPLGSVLIRSDLRALRERLIGYGAGLLAVLLASFGAAYLLLSRLRRHLARAEEDLHALNATLEQRVAERTRDLEIANRELEAFSYSVSHDLRAPLRAINGFSQIIVETESTRISDDGKRLFERVLRSSRRMGELIDDILEYSRAGRSPLARTRVDVALVAMAIVKENAEDFPSTAVDFKSLPLVYADRAMLRQVLENLIGNAFKYSTRSEQPAIEIGARSIAGETVIYVRDNGVGFEMQYAGKLFGMFQRMHAEAQFPGTGVGLAIVKRLIERHGGRIWAEAEAGHGATFFFTLEQAQAPKAGARL
jgi:signal transduction histidine kinase